MDVTERCRADQEQQAIAHVNRITTMGQLTASIAHEVNQPLAAAVTNAHAALHRLEAQPPNLEDTRQSLAAIIKDGNRAGEIIQRIRGLIKRAPSRSDQLDINEPILEVIALDAARCRGVASRCRPDSHRTCRSLKEIESSCNK